MVLLTCREPDSDEIAVLIDGRQIPIPEAAVSRSAVLRTISGDVQEGERVPIPADEAGFLEWLKTVHATTDVQCQALLTPFGTLAVAQMVQVADGLGDPIGVTAGCNDICARIFPTTVQKCTREAEPSGLQPAEVLDVLPLGIQMRVMRTAPSLQALLRTLPPHHHGPALCSHIRTIDAAAALQIPHNWADAAVWRPGTAAISTLTHLTRLSAAVTVTGPARALGAGRGAAEERLGSLLGSVSELRQLRSLTLCGLSATQADIARLAACMKRLPGLTSLRLSGTVPARSRLRDVLQPCTGLETLSLARLRFTDDVVGELVAVLPAMHALSVLDLSHAGLTHAMCEQLRPVLPRMPRLQTLKLAFNQLGGRNMEEWLEAEEPPVGKPPVATAALQVIDLSGNTLAPPRGASCERSSALPFVLGQTAVTRLELAYTSVFHAGVRSAHAAALRTLLNLRCLRAQQCELGAAGVEALAEVFPHLHALTQLDLPFNAIGNDGAAAVAKWLPELQQLQVLSLAANSIGDFGAEEVATAASALPRLRQLSLLANAIGDVGARAVCRVMPDMHSLRKLILSANPISERGQDDIEGVCGRQGVQVLAQRGAW